jgi:hypothetical protein
MSNGNDSNKAVDKKGNHPDIAKKEQAKGSSPTTWFGLFNGTLNEPVPAYDIADSEVQYKNNNNSWIILGRDRPGSKASGYGGKGHTQAGALDLVVGLMAPAPVGYAYKGKNSEGEKEYERFYADKNFISDAARIYISQKTDVDKNFNLAKGRVGTSNTRSAIGIKADHVRVIAREGIKLVTRTDAKNSQGGDIKSTSGIDLIAGNDDSDLQPIVKGDNLVDAFARLLHHVEKLSGIVDGFLMAQMRYNATLSTHMHLSPFNGLPVLSSPPQTSAGIQVSIIHFKNTKMGLAAIRGNLNCFKANYLTPAGENWILSRYNNVN